MEDKERSYEWMDDLYDLYVLPSISALARDLSIGVDTLIAVHARKEPISHALAKKLMYLWALKLGKVYYPAPKPVFEIPEIRAERLQRAHEEIDDLYKLYPSISKLSSDLEIDVDTFSRLHAKKESISDALAKKLMYLWAQKLGKVYYPAPKPVFEIPEISAERLQRALEQIDDLYELYPTISKLSLDLEIDVDTLSKVISRKETIKESLAKQIMYLWVLKFGTTHFPAPRPVLEPEMETMEKGSAFFYRDPLYGEKDPYKDLVMWDILPDFISEQDYNNALTRVRNKIIPLMDAFYKTLHVEPTENISVATLYGPERREHRTFELHLIDRETDRNTHIVTYKVKYALAYSQGEMQVTDGNLPAESILNILRAEGDWQS